MLYFDAHPSVLKWSSEETVVPYISPIDKRPHRYFLDFTIMIKTRTGEVKKYIVEVKPEAQTKPPVKPQRKTQRYITEVATYTVNTAKWEAAREWAEHKGFEFIILTEKQLGIK